MHHKPGKSSGFIDTLRASIGTDASGSHISSVSEGRASSNAGGFAGKILRAIGLSAGSADDSSVMSRRNPSTSGNAHSPVRGLSALLKKITGNGRSGDASLSGKRAKNEKDKSSGEIHQSSSAAGSARRGASDKKNSTGSKILSPSHIRACATALIRSIRTSRGTRRALIVLIAFIIAIIAVFAGKHIRGCYLQYKEEQTRAARMKAELAERRRLTAEYNIEVREYDVYIYANETAVKNGYKPISLSDYNKRRNPHWIYPGNVFVMLDGSRVTVIEGDTLWNLAREKIITKHLAFFKVYDKARAEHTSGHTVGKDMIEKLRNLAFNDPQKKLVRELEQQQSK